MEDFPLPQFEKPEDPVKAGGAESSKKKKRTTKIPRVIKTEPVSLEKTSDTAAETSSTRTRLENIFISAKEKKAVADDEIKAEEITEVDQSKELHAESKNEEVTEEELSIAPKTAARQESQATTERAGSDDAGSTPTIEGEFADEAVIITRGDVSDNYTETTESSNSAETTESVSELELPHVTDTGDAAFTVEKPEILTDEKSNASYEYPPPAVEAGPDNVREEGAMESVKTEPQAEILAPEYAPPIITTIPITERERMVDPNILTTEYTPNNVVVSSNEIEPTYTNEDLKRAEKRGLRRGVLSGAVAAWWLGRRKRRAMERETEAAFKQRDKHIDKLENQQALQAESIKKAQSKLAETQRSALETEARLKSQTPPPPQETLPANEAKTETLPVEQERHAYALPAVEVASVVGMQPEIKAELRAESKVNHKETQQIAKSPEEQPITEATYLAPEGRRVETSAWHRYEVDEKTGKLIENPAIEYGEEFNREQRQEKLAREASEPHIAVQLGHTLLQDNQTVVPSGTPTSLSPVTQAQGKPSMKQKISAHRAAQEIVNYTKRPITWILALVLVVLLFLIGILR